MTRTKGPRSEGGSLRFVLAVLAAGLTVAATYRRGAFYPSDALGVAIASTVLIGSALFVGVDRRAVMVSGSIGALAAWWLATAAIHHQPSSFLPEGAAILGFLATFLTMRGLGQEHRDAAALGLAGLGGLSATIGLVAVALRHIPFAIPDQKLWRAATTLTYSNAAGSLLVISLLVGLGLDMGARVNRIVVCLVAAGLMATESRGALLAFLIALPIVPIGSMKRAVRPGALGVAAGMVEVATSSGDAARPVVLCAVVALVAMAAVVPPRATAMELSRRSVVAIVATGMLAAVVAAVAARHQIAVRLSPVSISARTDEWSAAFAQWRASPWIGVGPDVELAVGPVGRTVARFTHNEYLQMLADAGLIGVGILVLSLTTVAHAVRRVDVGTSCAVAAVVAAALAGVVDFTWHLPAIALAAGWAGGLAGGRHGDREHLATI